MADLIGADGYTGRAGALRVRNNNRVYQTTGVQSVLTAGFTTGGIGHSLELSARYHKDDEDRFQQDDRYQMVNGRMELTSAGAPGSQDNRLRDSKAWRSEEHTSELQSLMRISYAVFCLKKKKSNKYTTQHTHTHNTKH